jgi:hypothetical protein
MTTAQNIRVLATDKHNSLMGKGDMVTIFVGSARRPYILHKGLLTPQSPFFKAAFDGSFREGQEQSMEMPEEQDLAFDMLVQSLYTGKINATALIDPLKSPEAYIDMFLAYAVLADKVGIETQETTFAEVQRILITGDILKAEHMEVAMRLPAGHDIRNLFAMSMVAAYLKWSRQNPGNLSIEKMKRPALKVLLGDPYYTRDFMAMSVHAMSHFVMQGSRVTILCPLRNAYVAI